jgi:deoxyadenosine/deoxycytidine kinase
MIIHLNGMPGVGKLTIAKSLARILSARLIDNHRLIDAVLTCTERGSPSYFRVLMDITNIVLAELKKAPKHEVLIFTNALANGLPEDIQRFRAIQKLAKIRKTNFFPILLTCSLPENKKRLQSATRKEKSKLMNPNILSKLVKQYTLVHPKKLPQALILDVTNFSPDEAARKIKRHIM